jgi:hypothetical protein
MQRSFLERVTARAKASHEVSLPFLRTRCLKLDICLQDLDDIFYWIAEKSKVMVRIDWSQNWHIFASNKEPVYSETCSNARLNDLQDMYHGLYDSNSPQEVPSPYFGFFEIVECIGHTPEGVQLCQHMKPFCTFIEGKLEGFVHHLRTPATFEWCAHLLLLMSDKDLKALFSASRGKSVSGIFKEVHVHAPIHFVRDISAIHMNISEEDVLNAAREFARDKNIEVRMTHILPEDDL